jgi:ribonuclease-3
MASKKTIRPPSASVKAVSPPTPETIFGHKFNRPALLERALTHRSLACETDREHLSDPDADNEQLEFVGDAVLGLVVAESLFRRFPKSREGELTRLRASIVSRRHLGDMAVRIHLGAHLRLGKGEERSGGRTKSALLSNALEAVIAAIYLDGGLKAASKFIERYVLGPALPELNLALSHPATATSATFSGAVGDHKSALQEHLQAIGAGQPQYVLTAESGPDHRKRFRVEVRATDPSGATTVLAESEGSTKKEAQQEAARIAFLALIQTSPPAASVALP